MISALSRRLATVAGACALVVATANGQSLLKVLNGDNPGDFFGWANNGARDVNQDGYDDLVIGAPFADPNGTSSGLARVYSGKDSSILYEWHGQHAGDRFGQMTSDAGDVNKDGYPDVLIGILFYDGAPGVDSGAAEVYSGKDGSLLYHWDGQAAGDGFGDVVADAGDVNKDGYADVAVSARLNDENGDTSGMARVFSGKDGSILYTWYGPHAGDALGGGLDGAGDVNADGYDDIITGSRWDDPNGVNSGSATVFSGKDGSILLHFDGMVPGANMGNSVAGAGDINKDGHADVIVGMWKDNFNGTQSGSAMVFSGLDGSVLYTFHGDLPGDTFGVFTSRGGDVNHDGYEDIVISASASDFPASNAGAVRVFSGKDGSILFTVYGSGTGDQLGDVLGEAGDVNADGWADIVAGAYWNDANGQDSGTARVYSGTITPIPNSGTGLAGTYGVPVLIAGGKLAGNDPLTLKLNEARHNSMAFLVVGLSTINLPFKGGTMIPSVDILIGGLPTNGYGQLLLDTVFPTGLPSNVSLWFQYWVSDPAGPFGFSATQAAHGITP